MLIESGTLHTGRNCFNLFQISFSANTADTDPGVSGVSKDQKNCEKSETTHCQVDHPNHYWKTSEIEKSNH